MTPDQISTILGALARLEDKVDTKADKADVMRLEKKLDREDGRVTDLEKREIADQATDSAQDDLKSTIWRAALAIVGACGVLVGIAVAVIDHI